MSDRLSFHFFRFVCLCAAVSATQVDGLDALEELVVVFRNSVESA